MQDTSLYQQILGLTDPWYVVSVTLDVQQQRVDIHVDHRKDVTWTCPVCGNVVPLYDHAAKRTWRHLDSCQFKTFLHARIPRIACLEHGIRNVQLPWGERGGRFTLLMERLIIDVLQQCQTVTGACRLLRISWDEGWGVVIRAVSRGLLRRDLGEIKYLGVDEKSAKPGHQYVTIVSDLERAAVYSVAEGRDAQSLSSLYDRFTPQQRDAVQAVAMDMSKAFVRATCESLPEGQHKIVFDRFHIMALANDALNRVRQREIMRGNREVRQKLKRSKQLWLWGQENLPARHHDRFAQLRRLDLDTARAWGMKENLRRLWEMPTLIAARDHLVNWIHWAEASSLPPMRLLAKTLTRHMPHILNYALHPITSGVMEGINSKIQSVKRKAAGYRNTWNFMNAIMFYCGKLDLYPR